MPFDQSPNSNVLIIYTTKTYFLSIPNFLNFRTYLSQHIGTILEKAEA